MEAEYKFDVIKISYCKKHKQYWIWNCPDCMVDDYREQGYKAGIREVVELVNSCEIRTDVHQEDGSLFLRVGDISILKEYWQAKLKEWGL